MQLFGQLEALFVSAVLGSLHRESCQDKALSVLLDLTFGQIDLELKLQLFERPVVVLCNCLSSGGKVCLRIKKTAVPKTTLSEILLTAELFELLYTLDKVVDPYCC